jgi:glycosyltransferase involved in cell wall biosynthesis
VNQSLKDIEVIAIDDGSTDSSPAIIKKFAEKDPRIVVITKPNSGYGDSMNRGLRKARGKYIGIVESDDYVDKDYFESLYKIAEKNKVDAVKSNFYFHSDIGDSDEKSNEIPAADAGHVINPRENPGVFQSMAAIWSGLYRRDFLVKNKIDFLPTPGASFQDTGFNFKIWASAERAFLTTDAWLHYRIHPGQSVSKSDKKIFNVVEEFDTIEKFLKKHKLMSSLGKVFASRRFRIYYWNFGRLTKKAAREFLPKMSEQLNEDMKNGFYDPEMYSRKENVVYRSIANNPKHFLALQKFATAKNFAVELPRRVVRKLTGSKNG